MRFLAVRDGFARQALPAPRGNSFDHVIEVVTAVKKVTPSPQSGADSSKSQAGRAVVIQNLETMLRVERRDPACDVLARARCSSHTGFRTAFILHLVLVVQEPLSFLIVHEPLQVLLFDLHRKTGPSLSCFGSVAPDQDWAWMHPHRPTNVFFLPSVTQCSNVVPTHGTPTRML